jgi:hypothetical protein
MIDTLQPEGELGVEFFEAAGALAGQAQTGFKILLNRKKDPLGLALRPGMVRASLYMLGGFLLR